MRSIFSTGNKSVPKIIVKDTIIFFQAAIGSLQISNLYSFRVLFDIIPFVYIIFLSSLNRFKNIFQWKFLDKYAVKSMSKIPSHLVYAATLPCETLISAKQAINDKLQGSVATYLRCGGVVNNEIKKGLLLSL